MEMERFKRKAILIKDISIDSAMKQIGNQTVIGTSIFIGLVQGLKYNGSLKRGIKAGVSTILVFAGASAVMNLANNWETIKRQ